MQKRRVRPGTEGLAVNVDRALRRIGWPWENALKVKAEGGIGNTEFAKQHENGGFHKQETEKQQQIWRKLTSKCLLGR